MEKTKYENLSDEELLEKYRQGTPQIMEYLLEKYKNLVRKKANALFLLGGDTDDLIQEGMIGLFKAIRDYDMNKGGNFFGFAELCMNRQMYSAVEAAARKKHGPLNSYISLSEKEGSEQESILWNAQRENTSESPEDMLIDQENFEHLLASLQVSLSSLEKTVLDAHLSGMNYRQIAQKLGKSEKSIDNALQRIKTKTLKIMDGNHFH